MTIGSRIAKARKNKGYTQEYMAQMLGVSRQAVSKWENDQSAPDTGNLIALSELLGVTVDHLATGTEIPFPTPESCKKQNSLAHKLHIGSFVCLIVAVICWFIGLFSGEFTDMVQVPVADGIRMGLPLLLYGDSPVAVCLLAVEIICLLLMILLLYLGCSIENKEK